jgi:hypothetical protein
MDVLLTKEVTEVGDSVLGVSDELRLGLSAVELLAVDVREDRRNLAI